MVTNMPPVSSSSSSGGGGVSFICLISCFLFISVVAGGGCLLMYMILPDSQTIPHWLPIIGVTLVCLPWLFWFLTFIYRLISRAFGFRGAGSGSNAGGGGAKNTNAAASNIASAAADQSPAAAGTAMIAGGETELGSFKDGKRRITSLSRNSSAINASHAHESEMPLALSMAS